jgi:DNA mismatch endonuclease, patch repair protein
VESATLPITKKHSTFKEIMGDILSKDQRSVLMSKVRGSDTKPEWILRCALHRLGFRYKLKNKNLPGNPDLVLPKYHTVVFVHGCFWHRHPGCKNAGMPKTNPDFWAKKLSENVQRDAKAVESLSQEGWKVLIVWECDLMNKTIETVEEVANAIRGNLQTALGHRYSQIDLDKKELLTVAEEKVRYRIDKKP